MEFRQGKIINEKKIRLLLTEEDETVSSFRRGLNWARKNKRKDIGLYENALDDAVSISYYYKSLRSIMNKRNRSLGFLKFLSTNNLNHFLFMDFANLKKHQTEVDENELKKILIMLSKVKALPLFSLARFRECDVNFFQSDALLRVGVIRRYEERVIFDVKKQNFIFDVCEKMTRVSRQKFKNISVFFEKNITKDECPPFNNVKDIVFDEAKKFKFLLKQIVLKKEITNQQYDKLMELYKRNSVFSLDDVGDDDFVRINLDNNSVESSFYENACLDFFRWVHFFGESFIIERIEECEFCGRVFFALKKRSSSKRVYCSRVCEKKCMNKFK